MNWEHDEHYEWYRAERAKAEEALAAKMARVKDLIELYQIEKASVVAGGVVWEHDACQAVVRDSVTNELRQCRRDVRDWPSGADPGGNVWCSTHLSIYRWWRETSSLIAEFHYEVRLLRQELEDRRNQAQWEYEYYTNPVALYVIGNKLTGAIKVGISNNPETRLGQLKSSSGIDMELVCVEWFKNRPAALSEEARLHALWAEHRTHGEWFDMPGGRVG